MPGQFYDNAQKTVLHLDAATLSAAADLATIVGPRGKVGRVTRFDVTVTTGVTTAPAVLTLDTITPSLSTVPTLSVPVSSAGEVARVAEATRVGFSELPADSPLQLATDGGAAAGAGSIELEIEWR